MTVEYVVEVRRIVWGDHEPRFLGEVSTEQAHQELVRADGRKRLVGTERLRVYSFRVLEVERPSFEGHLEEGQPGPHYSQVTEMVAYGNDEALTKSITELWQLWLVPPIPSGSAEPSGQQLPPGSAEPLGSPGQSNHCAPGFQVEPRTG
jgi:hypothetical protein